MLQLLNVRSTGTTIWTVLLYWVVGGFYVFLDYANVPKWIRKYKVQPGTNEPVNKTKVIGVSVVA